MSALLDRPSPRPPTRRRSRIGALVAVVVVGTLVIGLAILGALEQQQANTCGTPTTSATSPPVSATPGQTLTGAVSWFGGPNDHTTGPTTADGKPVSDPGIAVYNTATLNGYWQVTFANGRTAILQQTDIGPAPWTGRVLDVLYSALPYIGYTQQDFPTGAQIHATYLGTSSKLASVAIGGGGTASAATATADCADDTSTGDRSVTAITSAANLLASMHVPYSYGGGHTLTPTKPTLGLDGTPPIGLDCSSSVSFVLQHAGFNIPTMTSTQLMTWGDPGPGQQVTIYANTWHTFLKIGNRYFGTSGFGHPAAGGGPAWFVVDPSASYLTLFTVRHPPGL